MTGRSGSLSEDGFEKAIVGQSKVMDIVSYQRRFNLWSYTNLFWLMSVFITV